MPKLSTENLMELLRRSRLLEAERLDGLLAELSAAEGPAAVEDGASLIEAMVRQKLLTAWQAEQLLEGRYKGFFLGKYKLLSHLGSGGMSSVYLAEHVLMHTRRAIKVLPKSRVDDSSYLARFHREARAAGALEHPNIARAYDVDNDGKIHYLVMEYVDGRDLQELVQETGPLPYELAAEYIRQAADGLACAHAAGLIHRDIKPANLLVNAQGVVKVLDMGLALATDEKKASLTLAYDEKVLGTADYLAPEQAIDSHRVDPRADLYSLGCTLYYLLTGHPPFPEGSLTQRLLFHQTKEPSDIRADRPDAPQSIVDICQKMMAKAPADRFQTAGDVRDVLAQWLAGGHLSTLNNVSGRMASVLAGRPSLSSQPRTPRGGETGTSSSVVRAPGRSSRSPSDPGGDTVSRSSPSTLKTVPIPGLAPLPEETAPQRASSPASGVGNSQVVGRVPKSPAGGSSAPTRPAPTGSDSTKRATARGLPSAPPPGGSGKSPSTAQRPGAGSSKQALAPPPAAPPSPKPLVEDLLAELEDLPKKTTDDSAEPAKTMPAFRHTQDKSSLVIPLVLGGLVAGLLVFGIGMTYLLVVFFKYQP